MHPLGENQPGKPVASTRVPNSLLINANLIAGGGIIGYKGLGILEAKNFSEVLVISPDEYRELISKSGVRLGGVEGDANFTWFVPEPSHMDNSVVDRLMAKGIVSKHFVASVLAIDIENPIFSHKRSSLLRFVPREFSFRSDGSVDLLTPMVIENIKKESHPPVSVEAEFLSLLESADAVQKLSDMVDAYLQKIANSLQTDRGAELMRIHQKAIEMRVAVKSHPVLSSLDETQINFLPLP